MKNPTRPWLLSAALLTLTLASCEDDTPVVTPNTGGTGNNVYVLNEGNYTKGNAAVSLFDQTSKALTPDIFQAVNQATLGDVVQSMAVVGNEGYVVVNNSNKIEVVSLPDFKSLSTVTGLSQPRYLLPVSGQNKAYLSEWVGGPYPAPYVAGRVSQLNLETNAVTGRTPVGINPGRPVALNGSIYVPNQGDNTVSVLSEASGALTGTIAVAAGPSEVVADKNGRLWVLCAGDYATAPSVLIRLLPSAPNDQTRLPFALSGGSASGLRLSPDGQQLYYSYRGAEYRMSVTDTALPTTPFIRRSFYGFDIDPRTNTLFATNAADFASPGSLLRYQPNGTLLDTVIVKINPNGVVFY